MVDLSSLKTQGESKSQTDFTALGYQGIPLALLRILRVSRMSRIDASKFWEGAMRQVLDLMADRLEGRSHLVHLGRLFSETVLLQVDETEFYISFEKGRVSAITQGPSRKTSWRFGLRCDEEALHAFWQPIPKPGFHDLFGLVKIGRAQIDGDILILVKNLRFFKEFMALGREIHGVSEGGAKGI